MVRCLFDIGCEQTIAIPRKHFRSPYLFLKSDSDEPAVQNVEVHVLHELDFASEPIQNLKKAGSNQVFRRNGRSSSSTITRFKSFVEFLQCIVRENLDTAKGIVSRDATFNVNVAEQYGLYVLTSSWASEWVVEFIGKRTQDSTEDAAFRIPVTFSTFVV